MRTANRAQIRTVLESSSGASVARGPVIGLQGVEWKGQLDESHRGRLALSRRAMLMRSQMPANWHAPGLSKRTPARMPPHLVVLIIAPYRLHRP